MRQHQADVKISIIVPNFNCARFLPETLENVLGQAGPGDEVLVIDGGSTDGSVDIIRRHARHLTFWVSERDEGQTDAINKGLLRCGGDVANWINSDDLLAPGALDLIRDGFRRHPKADFMYGDTQVIDERGAVMQTRPEISFNEFVQRYGANLFAQPSCFFRRSAAERLGWLNRSLHWSMDYDFYLRALNHGMSFQSVQGLVGKFRLHGGSKTGAQHVRIVEEHFKVHCNQSNSWLLRRRTMYRSLKFLARAWRVLRLRQQRGVWSPGRYTRMLESLS